ncbi:hypothetical protein V6N12_049151 [Hibiscus sabdariffa]|uniref:Uncharacterized protein n=1 Tax=Hibiscus sabdariffa TaxID=183260 RepID=A0ABR2EJR3_9ROSI
MHLAKEKHDPALETVDLSPPQPEEVKTIEFEEVATTTDDVVAHAAPTHAAKAGKKVAPVEISQTEIPISNSEYRATIVFSAKTNLR